MSNRSEVAELVIKLSENLDEAEQFSFLIPEIIRHCEKKFLISILEELSDSVKENIDNGNRHQLMHSDEELEMMFKQVDKILKQN